MKDVIVDRRNFISLCGGVLTAGLLVGCSGGNGTNGVAANGGSSTGDSAASTKISEMSDEELKAAWEGEPAYGTEIQVGYNGGACLGGFGIAQSQGLYENAGLNVKIVNFTGGIHEAVGTNKVAAGGDHIATVTAPCVNGMGYKMVTASQTGCKSLYVLSDSDIQSTKDLVGKTVGLPDGIGASDQNMVYRYLIKDGVDIHDVNYQPVSTDAVIGGMQKGDVQAVNASDMWARPFVKDGTLRAIRSITTDEDFKHEPCCVMIINSDFLEKNPITSYKLAKAFADANDWIQENPEQAAQEMIDNSWASGDVDTVAGFLQEWNFKISDEDCEDTLVKVLDDYKSCNVFENNDFDTQQMLGRIWDPLLLNN